MLQGCGCLPADDFPEVAPGWVGLLDERELPFPIPTLQRLLALDGGLDAFMHFEEHENLHLVPPGEAVDDGSAVLVNPPHEVVRHADVERAVALTRHDVDVAGHRRIVARAGGRSEEHTSELQSLMRISYAAF